MKKISKIITPCILAASCAVNGMGMPITAFGKEYIPIDTSGNDWINNFTQEKQFLLDVYSKTTNQTIDGVVVGIYSSDGTHIKDYTTDSNGRILTDQLEYGEYYAMIESCPEEYVKGNHKITFTISSEYRYAMASIALGDNVSAEYAAKFTITGPDNETVKDVEIGWYDENKNLLNTVITNSEGIVKIDPCDDGTYYFKVLSTPDGYVAGTNASSFTEIVIGQYKYWDIPIELLSNQTENRTINIEYMMQIQMKILLVLNLLYIQKMEI